jgi:hypothetical protein
MRRVLILIPLLTLIALPIATGGMLWSMTLGGEARRIEVRLSNGFEVALQIVPCDRNRPGRIIGWYTEYMLNNIPNAGWVRPFFLVRTVPPCVR